MIMRMMRMDDDADADARMIRRAVGLELPRRPYRRQARRSRLADRRTWHVSEPKQNCFRNGKEETVHCVYECICIVCMSVCALCV